MEMETKIPVKGALKNNGVEAYFSTVISTKVVPLKKLEPYESDLLTITDDDRDQGFKYVFQTRLTKDTTGEKIRAPIGMFDRNETYIDNNVQNVIDRLHQYY